MQRKQTELLTSSARSLVFNGHLYSYLNTSYKGNIIFTANDSIIHLMVDLFE